MAEETPEVFDFLLNCQLCLEPFDQTVHVPRILPCHHTFCSPCIAKLDRGGKLTCPNDRSEIEVSGRFPVDFTRAAVVERKDHLHRKGGPSSSVEEACQKHQDKKVEFFCSTCRSGLCSECAFIEHGNKTGHKIVKLGDVLEQVKQEIKSRSKELDNILESSLQPQAKMAATSLQETDASFKAAEQEIEDVFSEAVNALLDRKSQAVGELRSKWKEDRLGLEDQASTKESMVSSAKTCSALGKTVSTVGLPSHIVAQNQELERVVQEARAEAGKPPKSSLCYKVNTNLLSFLKSLPDLGALQSVTPSRSPPPTPLAVTSPRSPPPSPSAVTSPRPPPLTSLAMTSRRPLPPTPSAVTSPTHAALTALAGMFPRQPAPTPLTVTSPRQPAPTPLAVTSPTHAAPTPLSVMLPRQPAPTSSAVTSPRGPPPLPPRRPPPVSLAATSSTIQTPDFQLEPGRCNAECTLEKDGRTLTNRPRPQSESAGQSGPQPFAFPGSCGSVDLTQPALRYWTVSCQVGGYTDTDRCEVGLASLQSLSTCQEGERISDQDIQAPTILVVGGGDRWRLEGRGWTKGVDIPQPNVTISTPYTCLAEKPAMYFFTITLGFLYDNRQPQSPRVLVVETESCRLLGVRRLSPFLDLRPVLRVWPQQHGFVSLEVRGGPPVLDDFTAGQLRGLLEQMNR